MCNIINVFTSTIDKLIASLLNKSSNFFIIILDLSFPKWHVKTTNCGWSLHMVSSCLSEQCLARISGTNFMLHVKNLVICD